MHQKASHQTGTPFNAGPTYLNIIKFCSSPSKKVELAMTLLTYDDLTTRYPQTGLASSLQGLQAPQPGAPFTVGRFFRSSWFFSAMLVASMTWWLSITTGCMDVPSPFEVVPGLVNVYITMDNHHAVNGTTHFFYGHLQ